MTNIKINDVSLPNNTKLKEAYSIKKLSDFVIMNKNKDKNNKIAFIS